ncbi:MAG TPA: hypothetical protein VG722_09945 [Tepidisphaeraceae bacterium]|nr:hypothetical protein [Tepidisphaeraceae bacterium]
MNKTIVTILLGFLLTFAAGVVVGLVPARHMFPPPPPPDRSWLADQLHLTKDQRDQMQQIWSEVMPHPRDQMMDKRHELQRQRDDAVRDMLTPEQRKKFDDIVHTYDQSFADLQKERGKAIQEAIARTKLILNPEQRQKYEEILKHREADHANWEHRHHPTTRPPEAP